VQGFPLADPAIEQGRIQIEESKKPMKIDQHPILVVTVNMVELE
jgi:hypothetical protein